MGINARCSDAPTELVKRATLNREARERDLRNQIVQGRMSVMDYLIKHKGYKTEHAAMVEPQFRRAIFGA